MITRPAALAGLTLRKDSGPLAARHRFRRWCPSTPRLLVSISLYRLSDGQMTVQAYESLGGVQGAIGARAEHVFQQLGPAEQAVFDVVFHELGRDRRRRSAGTAASAGGGHRGGSRGDDARPGVHGGPPAGFGRRCRRQASLEVAHEALFRSWPRLRDAIERQRDDLRLLRLVVRAAREWDARAGPRGLAPLAPRAAGTGVRDHERLHPASQRRHRHVRPAGVAATAGRAGRTHHTAPPAGQRPPTDWP